MDGSNWWLEAIEVPEAWEHNNEFSEITIGVVDNGFDTSHEDLSISFPEDFNKLNYNEPIKQDKELKKISDHDIIIIKQKKRPVR